VSKNFCAESWSFTASNDVLQEYKQTLSTGTDQNEMTGAWTITNTAPLWRSRESIFRNSDHVCKE
jgi:hypothetical protein